MKRNIFLRKRDIEILDHIGRKKWVSPHAIHTIFWESKKESGSHNRRLRQLREAQFISSAKTIEGFSLGYCLTRKGARLLREKGFLVQAEAIEPDPLREKWNHDGLVNKVKNILLKSPLVGDFFPKYVLRKKLKKPFHKFDVPDGLFTLWINDIPVRVALEVDLFSQRKRKYEGILQNRMLSRDWDEVFFVVKDEEMRQKLIAHVESLKKNNFLIRCKKRKNGIYFIPMEEFLKKELNALFYNQEVEFSLNSLEKKSKEKREKEAQKISSK